MTPSQFARLSMLEDSRNLAAPATIMRPPLDTINTTPANMRVKQPTRAEIARQLIGLSAPSMDYGDTINHGNGGQGPLRSKINRAITPFDMIQAAVERRRAELTEQGHLGYQRPDSPARLHDYLQGKLPETQRALLTPSSQDINTVQTKALPGIGNATRYGNGDVAVTGRYGTGVRVNRDAPDPNRKIDGKPVAQAFSDLAKEQGTGNKYADAEGRVYKIPLHSDDVQHEERVNANRRMDEALARRARYRQNAPGSVS